MRQWDDRSLLRVLSKCETCVWRPVQGPTWQQAVQRVPERRVSSSDELAVVCKHDTYGISFVVDDHEPGGFSAGGSRSGTTAADLAAASGANGAMSISDAAAGLQQAPSASSVPASDGAIAGGATSEGRSSAAHTSQTAAAALPLDAGVPLKVIEQFRKYRCGSNPLWTHTRRPTTYSG